MNIILSAVGGTIVLALIAMFVGLFLAGIDRRIVAHMQARMGPPLSAVHGCEKTVHQTEHRSGKRYSLAL